MRLRNEAESGAIAIKAPGTALLDDLEAGFVVPVDQLVGHFAVGRLVGQLQRLGAEPLHVDDGMTSESGTIPRTGALGFRSSSLLTKWLRPPIYPR